MTTNHDDCCCTETLDDLKALSAAYASACHERARADAVRRARQELAAIEAWLIEERMTVGEARLVGEQARGHRIVAPDITPSRDHGPTTPDVVVPGPSGALGRPGSEIRYADAYPHKNGPESPSATGRP